MPQLDAVHFHVELSHLELGRDQLLAQLLLILLHLMRCFGGGRGGSRREKERTREEILRIQEVLEGWVIIHSKVWFVPAGEGEEVTRTHPLGTVIFPPRYSS